MPPTPFVDGTPDEAAFRRIIAGLAASGVDSIGALGSTGHYAYLSVEERVRLTRAAVEEAGDVPVLVSIGAPATRTVLELAEGVQSAGASGVLLAPVLYQRLTRAEALGLYRDACAELSVQLCIYDNPGTTGFTFDDELYAEVAALGPVASVKIPGVPLGPDEAGARVAATVATQLGLGADFLPRPLLPLGAGEQAEVAEALAALGVSGEAR